MHHYHLTAKLEVKHLGDSIDLDDMISHLNFQALLLALFDYDDKWE